MTNDPYDSPMKLFDSIKMPKAPDDPFAGMKQSAMNGSLDFGKLDDHASKTKFNVGDKTKKTKFNVGDKTKKMQFGGFESFDTFGDFGDNKGFGGFGDLDGEIEKAKLNKTIKTGKNDFNFKAKKSSGTSGMFDGFKI